MGAKTISGEQVGIATLVDDAKVTVPFGFPVGKDDVDLVALERGLASVVLDANGFDLSRRAWRLQFFCAIDLA